MTKQQSPQISEMHGYRDGLNSATFKNPIHNNWKGKKHFDSNYERGYWKGYNEAAQQL